MNDFTLEQDSILEKMRILNLKHKYKETLG